MTRLFEQAVEAAAKLTPEEQDAIARMIFGLVAPDAEPYQLSGQENAVIDEGLAQLERGETASEDELRALLARYRP